MTLNKLDLPVQALFSTLGRTAARTLETKIFVDALQTWYDNLVANIKAGDVKTFNE
jgi:hydrogenase large subunit